MRRTRTVLLHFSANEGENVATIGGKIDSMNRMRMQSSPRSASGRRVVAGKRTQLDETKNCVRKLLKREINRAGNLAFNRTNSQEKFRNFHLQLHPSSSSAIAPCCLIKTGDNKLAAGSESKSPLDVELLFTSSSSSAENSLVGAG